MNFLHRIEFNDTEFLNVIWITISTVARILIVLVIIQLCVAYLILWERKLIGWMHMRHGPNRVGPAGLLQPIADLLKLLMKEVIQPTEANYWLYIIAPVIAVIPAFSIWAVIPFQEEVVFANVNAGLLYAIAISSISVYAVILGGWASNSKYAFLGAMRAAAQMVSYEISMGFSIMLVLMTANSLNLSDIVYSQQKGFFTNYGINFLSWNWLPLFPGFIIYFISGIAETNRHPFDVAEGESEIVAGHMVDYSGMAFALFFLAEYINMIVISTLASILFLGGWDAPFKFLSFIPGIFWLALKVFLVLSLFIWIRATFPRYRYDQIMRLGWKVFLPISVSCVIVIGLWIMSPLNIWK
ncbi:MAG: NADH-quinone oxidoreductase subunit NuoH [Burkholderia sp.]|nr:NADH-quinone oxidoreductase subunit NuoH [Burkholderia sp.]